MTPQKPYEFVTREEVLSMWKPGVGNEAIRMINRLFAEREAFRQVATELLWSDEVNHPICSVGGGHLKHSDFKSCQTATIDAEARRILEEKK